MEDNNAIQQQSNVVSTEEKCKQLEAENTQLRNAVNDLYNRTKQLENAWLMNRASFLFEVLKSEAFDGDTKTKAEEELKAFLFPEPVEEVTEQNN